MTNRINRRTAIRLLLPLVIACGAITASVQAQPAGGPITWIVPYAPGAATDALARYLASAMSTDLGQTIVVENIGGAGTALAASQLAHKRADGTQVMTADISTLAINPAVNDKLNYDPKSFTHIGMFANLPFVLVGNVTTAPKTFAELLAAAKKQPDTLN